MHLPPCPPRSPALLGILSLVTCFLCHPILAANTLKHGVVGYGISMYKPVCCYACHDSLSSLYLNCTTFMAMDEQDSHGMGMDMKLKNKLRKRVNMDMELNHNLHKRMDMGSGGSEMAMTSDACRASDRAWLQTLAYCVHDRCTHEGVSAGLQNQCFKSQAAGGLAVPNLRDALPQQAPGIELANDATWLNTTSLVNNDLWTRNYGTLSKFEYSEDMHTRYS